MPTNTQAFIVRIWHEETDAEGQALIWRGSIDHVGSQRRLYFQDLAGIPRFIEEQTGLVQQRRRFSLRSILSRLGYDRLRTGQDHCGEQRSDV